MIKSLISKFKNKNILLILILIFAAFLRLYRIADYMTFLGDEGRDVLVAYNILHGHLTLLGPTSSVGGFFLGPIYYYFMAPFLLLFNYNPVGPAVMVALFGIATVWLLYKFCSELFNSKIGLIAAFFYTISPLVISYSRSSWNPNPLPFFSLLTLFSLYKGVEKKSLKLIFASGILLGVCLQLHYLALFLGAIVFFYILFSQISFKTTKITAVILLLIKQYLTFFLGFIIGWSPFLAFEVRHGFPDFRSIIDFVLHSGNTGGNSNFFSTIYDVFFRIFGRLVLNFPQADQLHWFNPLIINLWTMLILTVAILASVLLVFNFLKFYKSENFRKYLLIFLWGFVGIILFGFYKKSIYDYYFSFMFPLPFVLTAALIVYIFEFNKLKVFGKIIAVLLFLLIFALNIQGIPFRYPANRQLNQMRTIADFVMTKTDAKPFNFALISGGNSDYAYRYFFTIWNHPPDTIQYPGVDPKRTTVKDQLLVVCESPLPCSPVGNSLWEIAGFGQSDIAGHWQVSVVEIYKLVHYKGK
jgi:4-amino-4-deoxy-L-arabinose transferase-like glycosyltransferase